MTKHFVISMTDDEFLMMKKYYDIGTEMDLPPSGVMLEAVGFGDDVYSCEGYDLRDSLLIRELPSDIVEIKAVVGRRR